MIQLHRAQDLRRSLEPGGDCRRGDVAKFTHFLDYIYMFILGSGEYVPTRVVDNPYFARLTGRPVEWFTQRTGIIERRRAGSDENVNTMATAAVHSLIKNELSLDGVDLIIAVSYTPLDTIATIAHVLQRQFELRGARALYLSTACSSFMDALDVAQAYFDAGRARKALIVASEHNSAFSRDDDEKSGHLWGDGAAALLLSAAADRPQFEVVDVQTQGLGHLGDGPASISLNPATNGLVMRHGKQVFAHACHEMAAATRNIVSKNGLDVRAIRLFVPHQANKRIIDHVAEDLELPADRAAVTISELGNTGCASVAITLHRFGQSVPPGEHIVLVTFGGGYSAGAALLKRSPHEIA